MKRSLHYIRSRVIPTCFIIATFTFAFVQAEEAKPLAEKAEAKEEVKKEAEKAEVKPEARPVCPTCPPKPPEKPPEKPKGPAFLVPVSLGECGDITYKPGLRIQVRYTYDDEEHNNDFFIRRFRLKASGDVFGLAKYGAELKIDNTGRFGEDPKARVENAWLDFRVYKELLYIRVGLYDLPFSRDALTSDSKLLLMDRSLIKEELTALGLADNTIGVLFHGRPYGGRFEYAVGIFDNEVFERIGSSGPRESDQLMPTGRFVVNFLDPATPPDGYADYLGTYFCKGRRLAIGVNAAYLGSAEEDDNRFDLYAFGVDLFYNVRRFTFQAEYDWFHEDVEGYGWYVRAGYLFWGPFEFVAQYEELKPNRLSTRDHLRWTTVGFNVYLREHYLKVLTDYIFKSGQPDLFQIQLQFDF